MGNYTETVKLLEYLDAMIRALSFPLSVAGEEAKAYVAGFKEARFVVERFPTADAVPVVRCKDCVHWEGDPDTYSDDDGVKGFCMKSFERANEDDFCSHGERKTT